MVSTELDGLILLEPLINGGEEAALFKTVSSAISRALSASRSLIRNSLVSMLLETSLNEYMLFEEK